MKYLSIIILLFVSCSTLNQSKKGTCEKNGMIDFMYIHVPCNECIELINSTMKENLSIFNYEITENTANGNTFILINYCYNYDTISKNRIEKDLLNKGFVLNNTLSKQQKDYLKNNYCK